MEQALKVGPWRGVALLAIAAALPVVVAACGDETTGATMSPTNAEPTPSATGPAWTPTFLPGLPIDTPPAEASPVLSAAPAGEEAQWEAVAWRAHDACGFDAGQPEEKPEAIFKTTAGEVRRLSAWRSPEGQSLGSNWHNPDTIFIVVFRGVFPMRPGPPVGERGTPVPIPPGNGCVYYGNGQTNDDDNASVGHTTLRSPVNAIEDLLAQQ